MPFVGRYRETQVADKNIGSRSGSASLFVGEPGVGKSALAREIAARHHTVVVTASASERMWPYSGLSAVAAGLSRARATAVDGVLARGRDWPEHLLAEEVSRTLHLIDDEPDVLVVDDLDEMDSASITVLSFVFGRLRGTGLSVVATAGVLDGRHDFAGMAHMSVERLSFEESLDLARAIIGPNASPAVLHTVAEYTGGDPGLIARVRLTPAEAAGDTPLPLPLHLAEDPRGGRRRIRRPALDPRISSVLDLLSVGPLFSLERLHVATREIGLELDSLLDDGLVAVRDDLVRIADPALRLRLHAALPAEGRRRLHARAAQEHAQHHREMARWHESFLSPAGDREALLVAAVELARAGEAAAAVELAERALAGDVDERARVSHLVDLADALVLQGEDVRGRHYLQRAGTITAPAIRARAALARLRATAAIDHTVDEAVRGIVMDADDARMTEHVLCESARLHLWRGEMNLACECIATAHERGVAGNETLRTAQLLRELGVDLTTGVPVPPPIAQPGVATDTPLEEALLEMNASVMREEYTLVRRRIRALLERTPRPAALWRNQLLRLLATTETRGGDPAAAREAVTAWRREWGPGHAPDVTTVLVLASAAAIDPLATDGPELVARGRDLCRREDTPALLPWFSVIDGGLALAEGRFDDAVRALREATASLPAGDPSLLRADADLIEALWLSGRRPEARQALTRLEAAAPRHPRRWTTLALARSRAVCRSDHDGVEAFGEAEGVVRIHDAPFERWRLAAARERCLPPVERAVVPAPRRPGIRGRTLTPQEQEVIGLVGRGLRNREIASELFLSLRTVELRLTGIYRALGVTSRVQLVALLHGARTP